MYTAFEVAEQIGINVAGVYRLIHTGLLDACRIPGRRGMHITEDSLERLNSGLAVRSTKMLNVGDVSRLLGLTPETVRRLIHEGRLIAYKFGGANGSFRIPLDALETFLHESTVQPEEAVL